MPSTADRNPPGLQGLHVWQGAMRLAVEVYEVTRGFPSDERFGLATQLRRAAISVPSNIAEGYGRGRAREFQQFLRVARGSVRELDTQLELARRLGYTADDITSTLAERLDHLSRSLTLLIRADHR
jgi:four helix bundle protein